MFEELNNKEPLHQWMQQNWIFPQDRWGKEKGKVRNETLGEKSIRGMTAWNWPLWGIGVGSVGWLQRWDSMIILTKSE